MRNSTTALHRAVVASTRLRAEVTVFFEVPRGVDAAAHEALESLVCLAWHEATPDDLHIYNCFSEAEMLGSWALGDESTGDMRLFEDGFCHGAPTYAEPERTLMLVSPATLKRLVTAQRRLPIVVADDATRPLPLAS